MSIPLLISTVIVLFIVVLLTRAIYTFTSIGLFRGAWQKANAQQAENDSFIIVALGDSTVQGIGGLRISDSFINQVAVRITSDTGKAVKIINLSVSGADSGQLLETQLSEFKKLKRSDAVVVAVGPNDITHKKSLESFLKNYETLLSQLPAEKTVIASLPPMGPKDTKGRSSYEWGQALKSVAKKYNVAIAPVFDKVKPRANDFRTYGGDFYHPSRAGYKLWADAFTPEVEKILKIK